MISFVFLNTDIKFKDCSKIIVSHLKTMWWAKKFYPEFKRKNFRHWSNRVVAERISQHKTMSLNGYQPLSEVIRAKEIEVLQSLSENIWR